MTAAWHIGGFRFGAHSFGDMKIYLVEASGLTRDALHIYVGLAIYLALRTVLRRWPAARWAALAVVVAAALGGEVLDHWHELSKAWPCNRPEHLHDLWNSALAPAIFALSEPLWAGNGRKADAGND